jgi:hypothetical protein
LGIKSGLQSILAAGLTSSCSRWQQQASKQQQQQHHQHNSPQNFLSSVLCSLKQLRKQVHDAIDTAAGAKGFQ